MKTERRCWSRIAIALCFLLWGAAAVHAQGVPSQNPGMPSRPGIGNDPMNDPRVPEVPSAIQHKMATARNDERQKRLVADTDELLALATKLKEEVDKTDKYTLSLDVVKRTAEIEKLAKSIRERMKD